MRRPIHSLGSYVLSLLALLVGLGSASSSAQGPSDGALLVVTKQSYALAIVDGKTLQVIAHVPIGEDPHEVVIGPDNRTAFVSNYGEGTLHTLAVVDLVARKPLSPIDISPLRGAHGLYLHGETLWFTAEGSESVASLDPRSGKITSVLGTGQLKTHLVWVSRDGNTLLASNAGSQTMSLFRRAEVHPSVVPGSPAPPASYIHDIWQPILLPVGTAAEGFAVSPDEHEAWVGDAEGRLTILDLSKGESETNFPAGIPGANRLKFTPDGRLVLITTHTGTDLVVFDAHTRQVIKRVPIEQHGASGIAIEPNGKRAFIACPRDHYVAVVDLDKLEMIAKIDAGREPDGLAWWSR
jgi:DNA-binding beta-propeller fold protein YncE